MTLKIISADSHIMEPPGLWAERLDRAFRDRAPQVVNDWKGKKGEFLVCEGRLLRPVYGGFPANKPIHEIPLYPQSAHPRERTGYVNARPGGWDPVERIKDQEIDGVGAEVLYATSAMLFFSLEDRALQQALFRAYNDWLADFCSHNPNTTLLVWLVGPNMLRQRTLTSFLPASTNAVFQGFLAGYDYLNLSISEIFPLKINNLVTVTK